MKIENIDVNKTLDSARKLLEEDKNISPSLRAVFEVLLVIITLFMNRFNLNSKNSSKPPSKDPNREKRSKENLLGKKPGGQKGHAGNNLRPVENPDEIIIIPVDKKVLPKGEYQDVGYDVRQVINIISVSSGSIFNFNKEAYNLLERFDGTVKLKLIAAAVMHVDETGINVNGKNAWIHLAANELWTYFFPHKKRGSIAMDEIGILPLFQGTLIHDHWKPYFIYQCIHALCNAHHLRELQRAYEQDNQKWALDMRVLLIEINNATKDADGSLPGNIANEYCEKYRAIIAAGELECPPSEAKQIVNGKKKRGRIKKSRARNLLERLASFEKDTLRFMEDVDVPFTNNLAENNIRMTKVQQKISGCFRSMEGAYIFCRVRSYISTCRKHGMPVTTALKMLFKGEMPDFMHKDN